MLTCLFLDGGVNPNFNEKLVIVLVPGIFEFSITIWNENFGSDKLIGSAR